MLGPATGQAEARRTLKRIVRQGAEGYPLGPEPCCAATLTGQAGDASGSG